jgi:CheY-like chemotaxis protein
VLHLTHLVDDLLDATRIAHGKIQLHRSDVDLRELVGRAAEDQRDLVEAHGLALVVERPEGPVVVRGDEVRLLQALANLLHNAAKFTPRGGRVTLSLARADGMAEIRVRDTGAGIDPALLKEMFKPFAQAKQTLARTEGGLGLGLAFVKGLVELHDGTVAAASEGPGKGSEFTVRLPLAPARTARDGEALGPVPAGNPRKRRRVLVVDDNHDAAETLAELVRLLGHDVDVAFDGLSAIAQARRTPPEVVLCDIGLPGMSGYDVAKALRATANGVRIIALSGYAQPGDVQKAAAAGFDGHVAKPADPDQLRQLLE